MKVPSVQPSRNPPPGLRVNATESSAPFAAKRTTTRESDADALQRTDPLEPLDPRTERAIMIRGTLALFAVVGSVITAVLLWI